jgi:hypothetical protein
MARPERFELSIDPTEKLLLVAAIVACGVRFPAFN